MSRQLNWLARRSDRVPLAALVSLRRSGQLNYRVQVHDVSIHGCRVEFVEQPAVEEQLWVKFDGVEPLAGEVCWVENFVAGVNFVRPLHPAVFQALVGRLNN